MQPSKQRNAMNFKIKAVARHRYRGAGPDRVLRRQRQLRTPPTRSRGRLLRPRGGQRAGLRGLRGDRRRRGRRVPDVVRRLRATRAAPSWAASRPTSCTSRSRPTSPVWSTRASSPRTGRTTRPRASPPPRSWCSWSARATPRTSRPGTTWSSPASRSSRPNPGSSGSARWNILAGLGPRHRQRRHRGRGGGVPHQAAEQHDRAPGQRRERRPRRSPRATATSCSPTRTRRSWPSRTARTSTKSSRRTPCSSRTPPRSPRTPSDGAQGLPRLPHRPEAQADYAQSGFRPVVDGVESTEVEGANDPADPFPAPEKLFTIDDDFGGWAEAADKFFDDGEDGTPRHHPEAPAGHRARWAKSDRPAGLAPRRSTRPAAGAGPGAPAPRNTLTPGAAARARASRCLVQPAGADPALARGGHRGRRRLGPVRRRAHQPADLGGDQAHRRAGAARHGCSTS